MDIYNLKHTLESCKDPYTVASIIRKVYQEMQCSTEKDRIREISRLLDTILSDYRKNLLNLAMSTGKVRFISNDEAEHIHPLYKEKRLSRYDRVIYVDNPTDIRIPELYGAHSINIILNPEYDTKEHYGEVLRHWSHNTLYGWSNGAPVAVDGSDRPHTSDQRKAEEKMTACRWYAYTNTEKSTPNAEPFTIEAFVDFSLGDIYSIGTFTKELDPVSARIIEEHQQNPAQYLANAVKQAQGARYQQVKVTFISDTFAVVTTIAGKTPKVPLTCLTLANPPAFTMEGKTFTITHAEEAGSGKPATFTFQA